MHISRNLVRRIRSVDIYEVTEKELSQLERGTPQIINTISPVLGCLAFGTSFLRDLLYQELSRPTFIVFTLLASTSFAIGFFLILQSVATRREKRELFAKIREQNKVNNTIATDK